MQTVAVEVVRAPKGPTCTHYVSLRAFFFFLGLSSPFVALIDFLAAGAFAGALAAGPLPPVAEEAGPLVAVGAISLAESRIHGSQCTRSVPEPITVVHVWSGVVLGKGRLVTGHLVGQPRSPLPATSGHRRPV